MYVKLFILIYNMETTTFYTYTSIHTYIHTYCTNTSIHTFIHTYIHAV